ncbi:MAG: hypothetical protein FIA99_16135 [Ruminiclostridium sp.]|nr:hypothetical protein [Ruminiclostridium sp.]
MPRLSFERYTLIAMVSKRLDILKAELLKSLEKNRGFSLVSEDLIYKRNFMKNLMPLIYENHVRNNFLSCAFCSNLARTHCHAHCLKCSAGSYIHCSPLLPGVMYYDKRNPDESEYLTVPWLYKKSCDQFVRLGFKNYLRNFTVPFSWVTIYNYEVLEGLVYGYSAKERPCFVCASIDYSIYRECMDRKDFDKNIPCSRISEVVQSIYRNANLETKQNQII